MAKTKKKTYVNVTIEDAQEAARIYAVSQNNLLKIEAEMNERLTSVKAEYQDRIADLTHDLEEPSAILEVFAREHKSGWGRKKSTELLYCFVGFRTGTRKVGKQNILKKLEDDCFISIEQDESFFIEAKIEEVVAA
jgi:hypothetical protein